MRSLAKFPKFFLLYLLVFGSLAVVCMLPNPAKAEFYLRDSRGGQIVAFEQQFTAISASGDIVRVGGNCLSACTLVLAVPFGHWCYEPDARLGFHAAWMPDENGRPVTSDAGTKILWHSYPSAVRRWISRNGGLTRTMIFLQGNALRRLFPRSACKGHASPWALAAITYTEGYRSYFPPDGIGRRR